MPLDPSVRRLLNRLAAVQTTTAGERTIGARREALEQLLRIGGQGPAVARVEARTVPGAAGERRLRLYTPLGAGTEALPGLIYFHGGGLVSGSLDSHDGICRALANASGCRVAAVDYRLAPEHRFPAGLEDALAATRWIGAQAAGLRLDPARIAVGGDSAGATLAAAVCQLAAEAGGPRLALQVLICPITDYAGASASRREFASGYLIDEATLEEDLRHLLPAGLDACDPRLSPLRAARLQGLAPAVIHAAEFDPLRDEAHAYAERLRQAGVRTRYTCHSGMIHLFYGLGALIPYATSAFERIGADIRAMWAP